MSKDKWFESWDGVDLDGTVAIHNRGDGVDTIGGPITPMIDYIKRTYLNHGVKVKIFTSRVGTDNPAANLHQKEMIESWTRTHFGQVLEVTATKDPGMFVFYDDRARQVIPNTGVVVGA